MPTSVREDRRQQRRAERVAAQKKAQQQERVRRWSLLGGGVAVIVVATVVIVFFALHRGGGGGVASDVSGPGTHYDDPVTQSGGLYNHVPDTQPVHYDQTPPNHGDHYADPMPWGVYDSTIPEGRFVHNLEHGGIDVLYHCPSACPDTAKQLGDLMNTLPKEKFGEVKLVVAPYDKSTHLISLVAWDWEQDLDSYDLNAIKAFYNAHVDRGPEQIP